MSALLPPSEGRSGSSKEIEEIVRSYSKQLSDEIDLDLDGAIGPDDLELRVCTRELLRSGKGTQARRPTEVRVAAAISIAVDKLGGNVRSSEVIDTLPVPVGPTRQARLALAETLHISRYNHR